MAFRFQKRIKVAPGIRINLSKSGISSTVGVPGANVNVGKKGVRRTLGLPGTGLSDSRMIEPGKTAEGGSALKWAAMVAAGAVALIAIILILT